ncbi:MAG: glycine-rich domain-containing protein [Thermomicrobiales bacterium]
MESKTIDGVKDRVSTLDLEPIKFKLVKENGYSRDDVEVLDKWYRRFLFLTFKYPTRAIVVSEPIDQYWHQHILDTHKYAEDCQMVFGQFLHHFPYFGLRGDEDQRALRAAYQATLELMREEFGETPDEELRVLGTNAADAELASLCSDCSGALAFEDSLFNRERPRLDAVMT